MVNLPKNLRPLFWDINTKGFDPKKHPRYTIERILEFGDEEAVRWLFTRFPKEKIRETIGKSRQLSERSKKFWKLFLESTRMDANQNRI